MNLQSSSQEAANPKASAAKHKVAFSSLPAATVAEVAVAMTEGARKYGRHNYRASEIKASTYFDATLRHLFAWWEGEDIDPDSGLHHTAKAIASLMVVRDAMLSETYLDDRPIQNNPGWLKELNDKTQRIVKSFPQCEKPLTRCSTLVKLSEALEESGNK